MHIFELCSRENVRRHLNHMMVKLYAWLHFVESREARHTAPQHLVCRVVQSLHINHMQTGVIEVFICRRLHMNTSTILICIWLVCRLCTALHTKCCGTVTLIACCGLRTTAIHARKNEWCEGYMFHFTDTLFVFPLFFIFGTMLLMGLLDSRGHKG